MKPKVEWPKWMAEYPMWLWDEEKTQQYVKMAHEYLSTMRRKKAGHQKFKDFCRENRDTLTNNEPGCTVGCLDYKEKGRVACEDCVAEWYNYLEKEAS